MFKKVLVAEDMDSINHAVASILNELNIPEITHAQYCDKAWLLAKKASQDDEPFDLLICDLSFKEDHRDEKTKSGKELIALLKSEYPNLKVLVNSIEDHPQTVKELWESGNIDGYVCKDRRGLKELKIAIEKLWKGETYNSPTIEKALNQNNLLVLNDFEINIVKFLSNGLTQDQIQEELKILSIKPSSKSAIEKRLKDLREEFNANTNPHLVSIMKDLQLI
ncbi:response regulator [Salegentibacter salegens]|uniref:DNA-binding response regulator, NarL/FixJ family, contains REC and HTH domains n=1 Tax=Salegentibacter salegens TaxID=143223 RepID=A0A1M7HMM1_9FLAO|nr:response regulator [Salegentibacter salegens]PRX39601.1 DNA-binding NarL/FixJ family response regulator [Salegentibacter salegens]SHM29772.1 DNA-binding response regulator, NarL/FixJ family, contains REC and HTH domains [Salegentibacter salegens]